MARVIALKIKTITVLFLANLLEVSALKMLSVCFALMMMMFRLYVVKMSVLGQE